MRITPAMIAGREPPPEGYTREEAAVAMIQIDSIDVPAELLVYADDAAGEVGRYVVDDFGVPTREVEILRGNVQIMMRSRGRIKAMLHEAANRETD
jgi:hypothetical protein